MASRRDIQSATSSSRRRHVRLFTVTQSNDGRKAYCSCVWAPGAVWEILAPTQANRSSNWAPVSLRYRWNRLSSRRHPPAPCVSRGLNEPRHDGRWFSGVSGTCTAGIVAATVVISAMIDVQRERVEKYRFKMSGQARRLFFPWASSTNGANSPKWSSSTIEASEAIVFSSVAFSLNAPWLCVIQVQFLQTQRWRVLFIYCFWLFCLFILDI